MGLKNFLLSIAVLACVSPTAIASNRLPTGALLSPVGDSLALTGTMAENMVPIPGHSWVAVLCSGARQSLFIVDIASRKVVSEVDFQTVNASNTGYTPTGDAFYGLDASADGSTIYLSRGSEARVAAYSLGSDGTLTASVSFPDTVKTGAGSNFVTGVAVDEPDSLVFAANYTTDTLSAIPMKPNGTVPIVYPVKSYPLAVVVDKAVGKVYMASERDAALSVICIGADPKIPSETISVGSHPDALLVANGGKRLFVANGDSDTISIIDTSLDKVIRTVPLRPASVGGLAGATPTGLCLSTDQKQLYVTLADMNAVAVLKLNDDLSDGAVTGYIPTGWYPTSVAFDAASEQLIVANAKGSTAVNPNPLGPNPVNKDNLHYIHNILTSTLSFIPLPTDAALFADTKIVLANNAISRPIDSQSTAVAKLLAHLPIKHVIYIIKENRTYDEVLGDLPQGNGDASLVLFGKTVTPNLHALASSFVTLDNFYCCAEVSADGWNWSTSGFANEYVQRTVPENYSESSKSARPNVLSYDYEGENRDQDVSNEGRPDVAESPGGYIWNSVRKANLTYRDYGAFLSYVGHKPTKPALVGHTDPDFAPFDLKYADSDAYYGFALPSPGESYFGPHNMPSRYSAWKAEFDQYVRNGHLPSFELVRFMRDHTSGTAPGSNTPQAMAADNDYAVGELVDDVSHSKYWASTAIFVVEDDAQNGPDHVDCHRSTCYVISPYIKRHSVDHYFYNTDSVLRSIELLLHSPAMTRYDSAAPPIGAFTQSPNLSKYSAIVPDRTLLGGFNTASSYGAAASKRMDFAIADDIPEDALNEILWRSIKGKNCEMPKPRHAVLGD